VRIQLNWFGEKLATRLADIEAGRVAPAVPRDAATVVILRTAADGAGVETLMLRRTAAMKFAPGAYVFPGGSVDPADYGAEVGWHGPSPAEFGARLGASAEVARALVCAAVRETFEESGVLLAGVPGSPVPVPAGPAWDADRWERPPCLADWCLWSRPPSQTSDPSGAIPGYKRNNFGLTIGGPIIPHHQLFFFFSVEPLRSSAFHRASGKRSHFRPSPKRGTIPHRC